MTCKLIAGYRRAFFEDRLTPYIEVDEKRLSDNLQLMQQRADASGVALRPHVKTHKSVAIAQRQLSLGACGITVAKPSEAIAFLHGGVRDILLAYPIVHVATLTPLLQETARFRARLTLIVDSMPSVNAIEAALKSQPDCDVAVSIKVDVGLHRVGVNPENDEAGRLAQALRLKGLRLKGLVSHPGQAYGAVYPGAISAIADEELRLLLALRQRLNAEGFTDCSLSVGSTPTLLAAAVPGEVDEIRPGNYALLDLTCVRLRLCAPDALALSVVTRVVATNDRYIIIDAGSKMLSSDRGPHGTCADGFGFAISASGQTLYTVEKLSEEHGFIAHGGDILPPGSLMRIFPNHSCAVMAMSDSFIMRSEQGKATIMPVEARGAFT